MATVRLKNIFIVLFFGAQLFLAMPGLLTNRYETEGRFSWNMYAVVYQCKVRYDLISPDGARTPISYSRFFNRPSYSYIIFHRDDLPAFNRHVCAAMKQRNPQRVIHASAVCYLNYRPPVEFIKQGADICTAPNYGVSPADAR
jgi:Vitamin K-dependent gamma-carboxylase, lumenal domain